MSPVCLDTACRLPSSVDTNKSVSGRVTDLTPPTCWVWKEEKEEEISNSLGGEWPFHAPSSLNLQDRACGSVSQERGVSGELWQFTPALMITTYPWLSRISVSPQPVVPLLYLSIKRRQEHGRSHDIPKHKNIHGSAQRGSQAVLAFASQFGLKSYHIMATLPELEIDTEAQWGATYRQRSQ